MTAPGHFVFVQIDDALLAVDLGTPQPTPRVRENVEGSQERRSDSRVDGKPPVWLKFVGSVDTGTKTQGLLVTNASDARSTEPGSTGDSAEVQEQKSRKPSMSGSSESTDAPQSTKKSGSSADSNSTILRGPSGFGIEHDDHSLAFMSCSLAAHVNGTCKPCRFFQLKNEGCNFGDRCKFCHYCSREEVRSERLRLKYDERRRKRRDGAATERWPQ
ncbi:Myosin-3 [Durusdinium trenchii]|uniref:Myosin-3 n=1 Tax=Durusdinium trenchii TaxID=1381693 RepID=A0ABP0S9M2_9DINO